MASNMHEFPQRWRQKFQRRRSVVSSNPAPPTENRVSSNSSAFLASPDPLASPIRTETSPSTIRVPSAVPSGPSGTTVGWEGVKTLLTIAKEAADVFPPLKSALGGLVAIISAFERTTTNQENFSETADVLQRLTAILDSYREKGVSSQARGRLDRLTITIEYQLNSVKKKRDTPYLKRLVLGTKDAQDFLTCMRQITSLINTFLVDIAIHTSTTVDMNLKIQTFGKIPIIPDASYMSGGRPACMEGTRTGVLDSLMAWATAKDDHRVHWLSGAVGTGKTTIAQSFCESLDASGLLGASFFCSRTVRNDATTIIPTICHELALKIPAYGDALVQTLISYPTSPHYSLDRQFKTLLEEPFESVDLQSRTYVVVIDGLDECSDESLAKTFVSVLERRQMIQLRFFLGSRPEAHIRSVLDNLSSKLRLEDVEMGNDLETYLRGSLIAIADDRGYKDWPSAHEYEALVWRSNDLFVYASTTIKYISEANPKERLTRLLERHPFTKKQTSDLYDLYALIVQHAFEHLEEWEAENVRKTVWVVVLSMMRLKIRDLSTWLQCSVDDLRDFHSVINVPSSVDEEIQLFHASFAEFIIETNFNQPADPETIPSMHELIAGRLLESATSMLLQKFNSHTLSLLFASFWPRHLICSSREGILRLLPKVESLFARCSDILEYELPLGHMEQIMDVPLQLASVIESDEEMRNHMPKQILLLIQEFRTKMADNGHKQLRDRSSHQLRSRMRQGNRSSHSGPLLNIRRSALAARHPR